MKLNILQKDVPIKRIWRTEDWAMWDRDDPIGSTLTELECGKKYHILVDKDMVLGNVDLKKGWNFITWITNLFEPFPDSISFDPYGMMTHESIDWAKTWIANTGFSYLLKLADVKEIKVVDNVATYVPNTPPNALASVMSGIIYMCDKGYMPGWDFPGTIIHEAVHLWQMKNGLTAGSTGNPGMEVGAYSIQQIFEWKYCTINNKTPRNLFKDRLGAIGLL